MYKNFSECPKQYLYTTFSTQVLAWNSKNNLLSYCGLVDAKIRASDNHLPVLHREKERTKKLSKFLRDFQDTRDKKKEFATNNVQHKVVYTTLRTRIQFWRLFPAISRLSRS